MSSMCPDERKVWSSSSDTTIYIIVWCYHVTSRQRYRVQKLFAEEVDDDEGGEEPPG